MKNNISNNFQARSISTIMIMQFQILKIIPNNKIKSFVAKIITPYTQIYLITILFPQIFKNPTFITLPVFITDYLLHWASRTICNFLPYKYICTHHSIPQVLHRTFQLLPSSYLLSAAFPFYFPLLRHWKTKQYV